MIPPSERRAPGQRGEVLKLPYIADPRLQREASPSDSELAAAHVSSPSLLGMPPDVFKRIAEYVLQYEQPEELVQKAAHRMMVEVAKAHVLTVSSEKIVRKPANKQAVARNLNTASLTNFFLVCRQFRDLGVRVYYGKNVFKFSDNDNLRGWAKAIGSRRKFVRSIRLDSHFEVRFRNGVVRPEPLLMVCDSGLISSTAFRKLPNLRDVHLTIGFAFEWQHDAFQGAHGDIDPALERICWSYAKQEANAMTDTLERSELRSHKATVRHSMIFDGAFFPGESNDTNYRQRMKAIVWKISGIDADLPESRKLPYQGLASFLPGPRLPNSPAIVTAAPTGAWAEPYVNDESIYSDSSRVGLVYVYDNWANDMRAISADVLDPRRLAAAQAVRDERAKWRRKVVPEIHASAELRAAVAERARKSAWALVMSELQSSALPAEFLESTTARSQWAAVNAALEEEEAARVAAVARRQQAAAGQGMRRTLLNARR